MSVELTQEIKIESVKAAPPVTVFLSHLAGITISDLVACATLLYIILQSGFLVAKWLAWRADRKAKIASAVDLDLQGTD